MTRFILATFLVTTFLLPGCKMEMVTELYSSDLRATSAGEENLTTPATLALPVTSADDCAEDTAKIVVIMKGIVDPFEPTGCERRDMNSFMLADLQIPLLDSVADWEQVDALFGIISQPDKEDSKYLKVSIMMNLGLYGILSERVKDEFYQTLDLDESSISIVLNNDEREDVTIFVEYAFVQGQPELSLSHNVSRRGKVKIDLSNVSVSFLGRQGSAPVFALLNEGES